MGQHRTETKVVLEQKPKVEERRHGLVHDCRRRLLPLLWCVPAQVKGDPQKLDVSALWGTYQANRIVRAASIHGMARE